MTEVDVEEPVGSAPRAPELHDLIAALERGMHLRISQELGRVEASVAELFAEMEARLADANALADELREENASLMRENDRYERAFATLRDMWQEER